MKGLSRDCSVQIWSQLWEISYLYADNPEPSWPDLARGCPVETNRLQGQKMAHLIVVITGLIPVIHAFCDAATGVVDGRIKSRP